MARVLGPLPAALHGCYAAVDQAAGSSGALFVSELPCDQAGDARVVAKGVPQKVVYQLLPEGRVEVVTPQVDGRPAVPQSILAATADGQLVMLARGSSGQALVLRNSAGQWQKLVSVTGQLPHGLQDPRSATITADGSIYVAGYRSVYRLLPNGRAALVAGIERDPAPDSPPPTAPATPTPGTRVHLPTPVTIDADPKAGVWITTQHRVYRLTPDGWLHTVLDAGRPASHRAANPPDSACCISAQTSFSGAALDAVNHRLYLRDYVLRRILSLDTRTGEVREVISKPPLGMAFGFGPLALHGSDLFAPVNAELWRLRVAT